MNSAGRRFLFIQQFRQTEIQNLHLPVVGYHHVARLNVAMNDAARVRRREGVGNLNPDPQSAVQLQRPAIAKLAYVFAFNVLHRDEVQALRLVHIEDRANVWVVQ